MKILGFALFVVGALGGYFGKKLFVLLTKKEPDEIQIIKVKGLGLAILLVGSVIIFKYI